MKRTLLTMLAFVLVLAAGGAAGEYGDIKFTRKEKGTDEIPTAVFPHYLHRMQFRCYVCHEDIFQMQAGANAITMEAIQAGKFCGRCHDGKTSFQATFEACPRCHRP
jgi:c(7)-type cytochrome triheme protein